MSDLLVFEKPAIGRGALAGVVATAALSVLMVMKAAMGLMPELNPVGTIANMLGVPAPVGWIVHFAIGTIWGIAFALVSHMLPGAFWLRGTLFSIAPWLMMMIVMMPMAGDGFFGLKLGMAGPVMTLVLHLFFGAVLGAVYGARAARTRPA